MFKTALANQSQAQILSLKDQDNWCLDRAFTRELAIEVDRMRALLPNDRTQSPARVPLLRRPADQ
jgi:hypothetical protein